MNDQKQSESYAKPSGNTVSESAFEFIFDTADAYQQAHNTEYQRNYAYRKTRQDSDTG